MQKSALNINYSDSETRVTSRKTKQQHSTQDKNTDDGLRKQTTCNDVNYTFIMNVCVISVIYICHSL